MSHLTFEQCFPIIEKIVNRKIANWKIGVAWYDAQDVRQEILTHIAKQWHKWDQSKQNAERYWQSVVHNQFVNKLRDWHFKYQPPCINCPYNVVAFDDNHSSSHCSRPDGSGLKDNGCELYAKWEKAKRDKVNLHYTVSDEFHQNEESSIAECSEDIDFRMKDFIQRMEIRLNKRQFEIFRMIFLDNLSWQSVAANLGVKNVNDKSKKGSKGYRLYMEWHGKFTEIGKEVLKEMF